jgi:hypothetical protein
MVSSRLWTFTDSIHPCNLIRSMANLMDLPSELIIHVVSLLCLKDLLSARLLNRHFDVIIQESTLLQYYVETQLAGVVDNSKCKLPTADKLSSLRNREQAWSSLKPNFNAIFLIPQRPRHAFPGFPQYYDFADGIYGRTFPGNPWLGEQGSILRHIQLPSSPDDSLQWKEIKLEHNVLDFALAVGDHDLVAAITLRAGTDDDSESVINVHLFQFSTGMPFKNAKQSVIYVDQWGILEENDRPTSKIGIAGENMVLLITCPNYRQDGGEDKLYVYKWRTGDLVLQISERQFSFRSFAFLTQNVLILPNIRSRSLDFWNISSSPAEDARPILSLGLPELCRKVVLQQIKCKGRPNCHTSSPFEQPFNTSADDSLMFFSLRTSHHMYGHATHSFVVHRHAFLALLSAASSDPSMVDMPWASWGPLNAGWLPSSNVSHRWMMSTYGLRYVSISLDTPAPIRIREYNPYRVQQLLAKETVPPGVTVKMGEGIPEVGPFQEIVHSALPFVEILSSENYDFDGVMIDQERILGLRVREIGHTMHY